MLQKKKKNIKIPIDISHNNNNRSVVIIIVLNFFKFFIIKINVQPSKVFYLYLKSIDIFYL